MKGKAPPLTHPEPAAGGDTPLQSDLRQLQEHHIKINVLPADAEEGREGAQLPEAEFFIQPDGADIVTAHLDIELGKAVFPRKGKDGKRLDPAGSATRAQCAAMLVRFLDKFEAPAA